jgi:hypothetical protein
VSPGGLRPRGVYPCVASLRYGIMGRHGRIQERCEKGNPAVRQVSAKPRASTNNRSLLVRQPGYRIAVEL